MLGGSPNRAQLTLIAAGKANGPSLADYYRDLDSAPPEPSADPEEEPAAAPISGPDSGAAASPASAQA